jgi:carbon-monoxide dehydrogenase small subunit
MSRVTLTVNGASVTAEVEPRTHLADFLREQRGLTGTHLGCEHGVCGACTLLIDGAPARSCIAFTVACDGSDVRTIEGLDDDPLTARLRAAFTIEHALQCGYCTPGMLVTARDIVCRLPDADEATIRLELAGNLCRCTGYAGIVRAIMRVLAEATPRAADTPQPLPELPVANSVTPAIAAATVAAPAVAAPVIPLPVPSIATPSPRGMTIAQTVRIGAPLPAVWRALRDPALIASCVPGARLISVDGDRISGELRAALGPIEALFTGNATTSFDEANRSVEISGEGGDARTRSRLTAHASVTLREFDCDATEAMLAIDYTLRGPLAQFARAALAREFAAEITGIVARGLEARLRGAPVESTPRLAAGGLFWRAIWRWLLGNRSSR